MNNRTTILTIIVGILVLLLIFHNVPKRITEEDKQYLAMIFGSIDKQQEELSFEEEIAYLDTLVNHLHQEFYLTPIDYYATREPRDLYENMGGLCYDFSRTIEKKLKLSGFQTRHVAVYKNSGGFFNTILSPGVFSHSLTEVKTKRGWMIIDSNVPFYAQDVNGVIFNYKQLVDEEKTPNWRLQLDKGLAHFYTPDVVFVYGLYSRHGGFYQPYNFIPDYNFRELFYNF